MRVSRRFVAWLGAIALVGAFASCGSDGVAAGDPGADTGDVAVGDVPGDVATETTDDVPRDDGPEAAVEIPDGVVLPDTGDDANPPADVTDLATDTAIDPIAQDEGTDVAVDVPVDTPPETAEKALVAINEIVATPTPPGADWLELFNYGTKPVDLSGWALKDNLDTHVFTFPSATVINAGQFVVIEGQGGTAPLTTTFGFGKADSARLFDAAGALVDETSWLDGQAPLDGSWGRHPDGTGAFATLSQPTRGAANAAP